MKSSQPLQHPPTGTASNQFIANKFLLKPPTLNSSQTNPGTINFKETKNDGPGADQTNSNRHFQVPQQQRKPSFKRAQRLLSAPRNQFNMAHAPVQHPLQQSRQLYGNQTISVSNQVSLASLSHKGSAVDIIPPSNSSIAIGGAANENQIFTFQQQHTLSSQSLPFNTLATIDFSKATRARNTDQNASGITNHSGSNNSLPSLTKKLQQRRNYLPPPSGVQAGSSSQNSIPRSKFAQSTGRTRIGSGVTQVNTQKRQLTSSRHAPPTSLFNSPSSLIDNNYSGGYDMQQQQGFGRRSRFQNNKVLAPAMCTINQSNSANAATQRFQQRIPPSFRKRRIDASQISGGSGEAQPQQSHQNVALKKSLINPMPDTIKSRLSVASAAVETQNHRPSVKKVRLHTVNAVKREESSLQPLKKNQITTPKVIEQNQMTISSKVPQQQPSAGAATFKMHRQLLRNPGILDLTTPSDKQDEQKDGLEQMVPQCVENGQASSSMAPLQAVVQYGGDVVNQNARISSSYVPRRAKQAKTKQVEEAKGNDCILDTSQSANNNSQKSSHLETFDLQIPKNRTNRGTPNEIPVSNGLTSNNSQGTLEKAKKVPIEFQMREKRGGSRPRPGPRQGQQFQVLHQLPYKNHQQQPPQNRHSAVQLKPQAFLQMRPQLSLQHEWDSFGQNERVQRDGLATDGKDHNHLINEMSYIQNEASSNDNLLSPHMFSNNSLSPTHNLLAENQVSLINESLAALSPTDQPDQMKFTSLENSLQQVVITQQNYSSNEINSTSLAMPARRGRRSFIRKISGPNASKMFPPGFFPDNSIDSKQSSLKISVDSVGAANHHIKQNEALEKARELVSREKQKKNNHLNLTLSPGNRTQEASGKVRQTLFKYSKDRISGQQASNESNLLSLSFRNQSSAARVSAAAPCIESNELQIRQESSDNPLNNYQPNMVTNVSLGAILAIDNQQQPGCDGLRVPMPSAGMQNILGRNASHNQMNCPPEEDQAPALHYINKQGSAQINSGSQMTQMSKKTTDTFSDRVQQNIKANETTNVTTTNNYALNQNWVANQQIVSGNNLPQLQPKQQLVDLSVQDTSMGLVSQSTAAASNVGAANQRQLKVLKAIASKGKSILSPVANDQSKKGGVQVSDRFNNKVLKIKNGKKLAAADQQNLDSAPASHRLQIRKKQQTQGRPQAKNSIDSLPIEMQQLNIKEGIMTFGNLAELLEDQEPLNNLMPSKELKPVILN